MNINTNDIQQIIKVIGSQGLGFFALYIIYHYLGQLFGAIIILKIVSSIVKTIDGWVLGWFQIKRNHQHSLKGKIVRFKKEYPHYPSLVGRYGQVKEDNDYDDNEVNVEVLKNYEKEGTDGEREGTYLVNKDFLEIVSI